jgi:transposase
LKRTVSYQEKNYQDVDINSFTSDSSYQIGGEYLCSQAIEELKIPEFLSVKMGWNQKQINLAVLSLLGRLLNSGSESETARWLNENSAAMELYPLKSGRINKDYLYDSALRLYSIKDCLCQHLNSQIEDIFRLKSKIILYDLTNSHFEGKMKKSKKAAYGKNKQKRSDCKQITLAMVTDEYGFCKYSEYYAGNIGETTTLEGILQSLLEINKDLLKEERPCVIIDAGISSEENLQMILREGLDYIAVSKSEHSALRQTLEDDSLVIFKNKSDDELSAKLFSQPFEYTDKYGKEQNISESIVYIKSPLKEVKERSIDQKKSERFEEGLCLIQKTVNNPRGQRTIEKIHQRIGRLKERNKGVVSLYKIVLQYDGNKITSLEWAKLDHPVKEKEQKWGTYFIRTSIEEKKEEKIWQLYRTINEVEEAFSILKSNLKIRPNHHHKDETIESHINLSVSAYQIVSFIRHRLKQQGITHGWKEIKRIMSTQKYELNAINRRDGKTIWIKSCTRPTANTKEIYKLMGYKDIPYYRKNIVV